MGIFENTVSINKSLPDGVKLVAVSKFHPTDAIHEAYRAGQRMFAESRMQELVEKVHKLPDDIQWHFIGHLQTNKVKEVIALVDVVESVDSERLLKEVVKYANSLERKIKCFLQVHISDEDSKYGLSYAECEAIIKSGIFQNSEYCYCGGLMGMASNTEDVQLVRTEFKELREFYNCIKSTYFQMDDRFSELSMGMSGDYKIAIEEGSTMVRLGSIIFGNRKY